ncbi:hypothetical protein CDAR_556551 [Caerostris darwini]|uniref:Uncharacterized protein n=1 Tax=Caerostris darwini TaxID=1538125 RepID=A0AAV4S527_9ARAC|nr:hypothetical protein CDAR_556551 [Caerostris darwini]
MPSQWMMATSPHEILPEPEFAEPIPNVTVSAGRDVSLPCVVDNLGTYRVDGKGLMRRPSEVESSIACLNGIPGMSATLLKTLLLQCHAGYHVTSLPGNVNSSVEPSNVPSYPL